MKQLKRRIDKLSSVTDTDSVDVICWINKGLFYDDLTDEQRSIYCRYHNENREAMETVLLMAYDEDSTTAFHFPLEKRRQPLSAEELDKHLRQTADEIAALLDEPSDTICF